MLTAAALTANGHRLPSTGLAPGPARAWSNGTARSAATARRDSSCRCSRLTAATICRNAGRSATRSAATCAAAPATGPSPTPRRKRSARARHRRAAPARCRPAAPTRPRSTTRPAANASSSPARSTNSSPCARGIPQRRSSPGATELGLEVNKKFYRFETLISLSGVPGIAAHRTHPTAGWSLGAAASLTRIEEALRADDAPSLPARPPAERRDAQDAVGVRRAPDPQPRHARAAISSTPRPSATWPRCCWRSTRRWCCVRRRAANASLPLDDFFTGYRTRRCNRMKFFAPCAARHPRSVTGVDGSNGASGRTATIQPRSRPASGGRAVCWIASRCRAAGRWTFPSSRRRSASNSMPQDACAHARLAYGGVAATTVRARQTEAALLGQPWNARHARRGVLPVLAGGIDAHQRRARLRRIPARVGHRAVREILRARRRARTSRSTAARSPRRPRCRPPSPRRTRARSATSPARRATWTTARPPQGMLEVWPVCAPHARARILAPRRRRRPRDARRRRRAAGRGRARRERCRRGAQGRNPARRQGDFLSRATGRAGRRRIAAKPAVSRPTRSRSNTSRCRRS